MSRRERFEDDGRTIADMSGLDGRTSSEKESAGKGFSLEGSHPVGNGEGGRPLWHNDPSFEAPPFSWRERLHYIGAALGAALLIAFVFLGGLGVVMWLITLYGV